MYFQTFADNKESVSQKLKFAFERVINMGKGEPLSLNVFRGSLKLVIEK